MALSRSEMEQCPAVPPLRLENAFSEKIRLGAGTCGWSRGLGRAWCWLLAESYHSSCWDERSEPLLTGPLLFISREERSQEETPGVSPTVVNPGL